MDVSNNEPRIAFDNTYARDLEGLYVDWNPVNVPAPATIAFNAPLANRLGLGLREADAEAIAAIFSGNALPAGAAPLAQAYAGHQFGGFSPQLGDGRAILLGEVVGLDGRRYDIQLKGAGRTPFSRRGDGKAALGPMLREYLMCEAMYALGIPTTRALAVVSTGEMVHREGLLPGAVLTRIASSHIRVGTFQFFAARGDVERLKRLADYSIRRHSPSLADRDEPYLAFFEAVLEAQAALVAKWMLVGFVHGVMNTDNMAVSGETIDYGPCAFIDTYEPDAAFSSVDVEGRYAYANQPIMAQWNLSRFAETLISLIDDDREKAVHQLSGVLNTFPDRYLAHWLAGMRAKLGLLNEQADDLELINALYSNLEGQGIDFTNFFRSLSDVVRGNRKTTRGLYSNSPQIDQWLERYEMRQAGEDVGGEHRAASMDLVNPLYIPRNHKVEEALNAAVNDADFAPFHELQMLLAQPFSERPHMADFARPAPDGTEPYVTFCGT